MRKPVRKEVNAADLSGVTILTNWPKFSWQQSMASRYTTSLVLRTNTWVVPSKALHVAPRAHDDVRVGSGIINVNQG